MNIRTLVLIVSGLMSFTQIAVADFSYAGYSRADDSDIVHGGGLQWLQWDVTETMTINEALAAYAGDGWRMATHDEMATLLNAFALGLTFVAVENNTLQEVTAPAAPGLLDTPGFDDLVTLFGRTDSIVTSAGRDPQRYTSAKFGLDGNDNGLRGRVFVRGDYQQNNGVDMPAFASMYGDVSFTGLDTETRNVGVALVKAPVPLPAAAWLFGFGVLGLLGIARRRTLA